MKELIKTYEAEILLGKKSMVEFALKDAAAYNVASAKVETYQRIVEDLKRLSEPPTVRPMSELPEGNKRFLFKVEVNKSYIEHVTGRAIINKASAYVSLDNYNSVIPLVENPKRIRKILGWLPLPNPTK